MLKIISICLCLFTGFNSLAQQDSSTRVNAGIEQDVLPYITGGYFFAAWLGENHLRGRVLTARVHKPDFAIEDGFANNDVTAYAMLADYFLKREWKGWWAGTGIVYWRSSIQTAQKTNTSYYDTWLLNGSIGYNFKFCKQFYLSPWGALNLRIAGDQDVIVDDKVYHPPLLNPEASLKLGAYF